MFIKIYQWYFRALPALVTGGLLLFTSTEAHLGEMTDSLWRWDFIYPVFMQSKHYYPALWARQIFPAPQSPHLRPQVDGKLAYYVSSTDINLFLN